MVVPLYDDDAVTLGVGIVLPLARPSWLQDLTIGIVRQVVQLVLDFLVSYISCKATF